MAMHTQQSTAFRCSLSNPLHTSHRRQQRLACRAVAALGSSRSSYFGRSLAVQGTSLRGQQTRRSGGKSKVILAAIFGVGAPEALLVGVVALVVFGPKGLAQAVKSLGATLRTFSPTIRELASVTNELSSSLQEQIGLDDIRNEFRNPSPSYSKSSDGNKPSTSTSDSEAWRSGEDKGVTPEVAEVPSRVLEAQIEESKRLAWGDQGPPSPATSGGATAQATTAPPASEGASKPATSNDATAQANPPQPAKEGSNNPATSAGATAKASPPQPASVGSEKPAKRAASDLSMDELEAELARRRNAAASK